MFYNLFCFLFFLSYDTKDKTYTLYSKYNPHYSLRFPSINEKYLKLYDIDPAEVEKAKIKLLEEHDEERDRQFFVWEQKKERGGKNPNMIGGKNPNT